MQIGNAEMDAIYREVIAPVLKDCGVEAKRVDKHNEGRLLNSEIVRLIREADIIVADLTNERQNCYLEVGYAMGLGKFENLVLCARKDHKPDRPGRTEGDPRVHFDLGGYDFLYWDSGDFGSFRRELARRVRFRLGRLPAAASPRMPWDDTWLKQHRERAHAWRQSNGGIQSFMEAAFRVERQLDLTPKALLEAAERAQVHTFGWPLGVVLRDDEWRPRPTADGIVAKAAGDHCDYWALTRDGRGYLLNTNFEETRRKEVLGIDTRIHRVTELFLYVRNLYAEYGVGEDEQIVIAVRHGGLSGRTLRFMNQNRLGPHISRRSGVDEHGVVIETRLRALRGDLVEYVKAVVAPMLALFDFYEVADGFYRELVEAYVAGRVA